MPRGAFLFSPFSTGSKGWFISEKLSQCPEGYFCFLHNLFDKGAIARLYGSQCPKGIFVSSNLVCKCVKCKRPVFKSQCPEGHFCFLHSITKTIIVDP